MLSVGPGVGQLAAHGSLVLFGPAAPAELREISIVTEQATPTGPIQPGDVVTVGGVELEVAGVGDRVDRNLADLGHVTIRMASRSGLPGEILVTLSRSGPHHPDPMMVAGAVAAGAEIRIAPASLQPA